MLTKVKFLVLALLFAAAGQAHHARAQAAGPGGPQLSLLRHALAKNPNDSPVARPEGEEAAPGDAPVAEKVEAPPVAVEAPAAAASEGVRAVVADEAGETGAAPEANFNCLMDEAEGWLLSGGGDAATLSAAPAPAAPLAPAAQEATSCIEADIVALDQVFFYNRLGAFNPGGMIYALRRDVVPINSTQGLVAGNVQLRKDKRARPIVLRMHVDGCLRIKFQNLLQQEPIDGQPRTRTASAHVDGLHLVDSILDDGSKVGKNQSSLVGPGGSITYTYHGRREGAHLLYSTAATTGGEGNGGSLAMGLFGTVVVEPKGSEWYRSQLTEEEMQMAKTGTTAGGHPILNYNAVYPAGHKFAGLPIIRMTQGTNTVHTDLNAIITGPNRGRLAEGIYPEVVASPDREQPFREFVTIYHDEIRAVQAFPQFEDPVLEHTLHSVRDAFAINYGSAGIGAEILANRFRVGPMHDCDECLYEEFFLSSWAVADPAMIVDRPANERNSQGQLIAGPKATKAFFPEDPSNVHHSYLNDHVKFRVLHAGPKEHHIHHLHAHQWLHTPDSDNSTVLDSQAIGPGSSFTTEILHGGSGNRNNTPGDAIFHCHFYPHFAMGMWELWRVHDVFEVGTEINEDTGKPVEGARALPDGEIERGTPIPAIVPVPTRPMPPMPTAAFKGYPFYIPGEAGHRPPSPPLDVVHDGGLPRHIILDAQVTHHKEHLANFSLQKARLDFDKHLEEANAKRLPEAGTAAEQAAMDFHAQRTHPSFRPDGTAANFITNGRPPVGGAPFADPCVDDAGQATGNPRLYKSANIQLDVKFNKAGWHFPQQRISTLWRDVMPTLNGERTPEPLFFRANTNDCITFHFTNLVPRVYVQDDFQVRTPTDVMGQHIHLVKFDVTSSDGAANGFNYEDGSLSPEEVQDRIKAINAGGGLLTGSGARLQLEAEPHPFFGEGPDKNGDGRPDWLGAQTTVQRWFADSVLNSAGRDRTVRTAFTHDHFGPSTHQQVGLYAGLVVEPENSVWRDSETGLIFGNRDDGGPTSWKADILTSNGANSYREFLLEFADFQHAYKAGGGIDALGRPKPDPEAAINPPAKKEVGLPDLLRKMEQCPGTTLAPPCPEAISAADVGTMVVNYRNEPVALRVRDNDTNTQASGAAGDLSQVYRSNITRADPRFNVQPNFYAPLTEDVRPGDPFTPLLRAYADDRVQIRILVGAHEEGHNFSVNGVKWLFEPSEPNSGFRNSQMMGISEHFEFVVPRLPGHSVGSFADYLYRPGTAVDDQWNGLWGIMRAYSQSQPDLQKLPNNEAGFSPAITNVGDWDGVCPKTTLPGRNFDITAKLARDILPQGTLVYNKRTEQGGALHDPTAIMYVHTNDLNASGMLKAGVPVEPLILRAKAGECINLTLRNGLPDASPPDLNGFNTMPMIVDNFNANDVEPSKRVGLHPQLVFYDVTRSDGMSVGFNPVQTVNPGAARTYQWYAGEMQISSTGIGTGVPIEFGATNLIPSDPIKHSNKAAIGALIIEPATASWTTDPGTRAEATVTYTTPNNTTATFREFVLLFQNDINLRRGTVVNDCTPSPCVAANGQAVPNIAEAEDPEDSGQKALNYRTEPLWKRMGFEPDTPLDQTRNEVFTNALHNSQVGGDPVTPVFTAEAGQPVRIRVLQPGGHARNSAFLLHGHIWEEEPYEANSTRLGSNPLSEWKGTQGGHGPSNHFDVLLKNGAGGIFRVTGDYLFRDHGSFGFDGGMWGIFRVQQP
jgi:hypothetical protein